MEANEAPEKIYLYPSLFEKGKILDRWFFTRYNQDSIEYTRTDAFIEKACKTFCKVRCNGKPPRDTCTSLGTCDEYDDFCKTIKKELL